MERVARFAMSGPLAAIGRALLSFAWPFVCTFFPDEFCNYWLLSRSDRDIPKH